MENFTLLKSSEIHIDKLNEDYPTIVFPHIDEIYIGYYQSILLYGVVNLKHNLKQIYKLAIMEPKDYLVDVVKMEATDELCVISKYGVIYKLSYPDENVDNWELIGNMDSNVDAVSWNSDVSTLAVVSVDGFLTLLGRYFDVISHVNTQTSEFGESRNISLGWGKTSTQFLGQGVRQSSKNKESTSYMQLRQYNDLKGSIISWRGDGKFVATSIWCTLDDRRKIKIWTEHGVLHSTCDTNVLLEPVLSWRPNGIYVTSTSIPYENEIVDRNIVFFERNGLRHGGFQLVHCDLSSNIKVIRWNLDSSLLAVVIENSTLESQILQVWTSSNYHWYLKYETFVEKRLDSSFIENIMWYSNKCLILQRSNGTIIRYQYHGRIDVSDKNLIGIIDGNYIMFTPFGKTVIPLPYTLAGCKLNSFPNEIICVNHMIQKNNEDDINWILTLQKDGTIMSIIEIDVKRRGCIEPRIENGCKKYEINMNTSFMQLKPEKFGELRLVIPINDDTFFAIFNNGVNECFCTIKLQNIGDNFQCDIFPICCVSEDDDLNPTTIIRFILPKNEVSNEISFIYVECANNLLYRIDFIDHNTLSTKLLYKMICQISNAVILMDNNAKIPTNDALLIYTDINNNLYIDENRIFQFCSSFLTTKEYLIVISKMTNLFCIPLTLLFQASVLLLEEFIANMDKTNSYRMVETGAIILCCPENDASLILQIPRGNIEVIYPRPLVISKLKKTLSKGFYKEGVFLIKKHRLDFNIIVDNDPDIFYSSIGIFIDQINDPILLNFIINEISSNDTTTTVYREFYHDHPNNNSWSPNEKVIKLMQGFRTNLEIRIKDNKNYFNSILLTYMKESEDGDEKALLHLKHSLSKGNNNQLKESLGFMKQYLQDDTLFYNKALGSYDLHLVSIVAEIVNKDPQEYKSFINHLNEYNSKDVNYMKYLIDCYLQQYDKALLHILNCEDKFDECKSFIVKHQKYLLAINNLAMDSKEYKIISVMYAEFLINEKKAYEDACLIYQRLNNYEKAFEYALKIKNFGHFHYKNCIGYLFKIRCMSHQQLSKYQDALLEKLLYTLNFSDAIEFVDMFLNDSDKAFKLALDYHIWEDLIYLSFKVNLYQTKAIDMIKSGIKLRAETIIFRIENKIEHFNLQYSQLIDYRQNIEKLISSLPEINAEDLQSLDTLSIGSSINSSSISSNVSGSIMTSSTNKTSSTKRITTKNRNKLAKKYFVTRPGSVYEHFALMESLLNLYNDYFRYKDECKKLLPLVLTYGVNELAQNVQSTLTKWREILIYKYADIWTTQQYLGPVRKDQHFPESHRPIFPSRASDQTTSKSVMNDVAIYLDSLTPLITIPDKQKLREFDFINNNLI